MNENRDPQRQEDVVRDNYDGSKCRICSAKSSDMPSKALKISSWDVFKECYMHEVINEETPVIVCYRCHINLNTYARNIRFLRDRQRRFRDLESDKDCFLCKTAWRLNLKKLPENDTTQIVFRRLVGFYVGAGYMYICEPCGQLVQDLDRLYKALQTTEIEIALNTIN